MQNNFYFLRKFSQELAHKLAGMRIFTCFSQNKDELIIGFAASNEKKDVYIRASLLSDFACLNVVTDFQRAKKNSVDLFTDLFDCKVVAIKQINNDRSFSISLENNSKQHTNERFELLFKMYGNRSNVVLFKEKSQDLETENIDKNLEISEQKNSEKDNSKYEIIETFHKKLQADWDIIYENIAKNITQNYDFFAQNGIKKTFPTFDKTIFDYLETKEFSTQTTEKQWEILQHFFSLLDENKFYVGEKNNITELVLFQDDTLAPALANVRTYTSAIIAINEFYYSYSKLTSLDKEKAEVLKKLLKLKIKTQNYLKKTEEKMLSFLDSSRNEEIANVLMANLHIIPAKATAVTLFDFYQNNDQTIKLKADLSPQKNAEVYYRKAKNEKIEIAQLNKNIIQKEIELKTFLTHIDKIEGITHLKDLRKYIKENTKLFDEVRDETTYLFKRFEFKDFVILVGKSAKNNDLLTQKYTYKEDLWLHAKDVSGSHVVIKFRAGKPFPSDVIEKAAQLAAYYSKRKNDTLCPVIVTPKKFVRKPKGMADGQVMVDKESVVMVVPSEFLL